MELIIIRRNIDMNLNHNDFFYQYIVWFHIWNIMLDDYHEKKTTLQRGVEKLRENDEFREYDARCLLGSWYENEE